MVNKFFYYFKCGILHLSLLFFSGYSFAAVYDKEQGVQIYPLYDYGSQSGSYLLNSSSEGEGYVTFHRNGYSQFGSIFLLEKVNPNTNDNKFFIKLKSNPNLAFDISGSGLNHAPLILYPFHGGVNQQFNIRLGRVQEDGSTEVILTTTHTNEEYCLAINYPQVRQEKCNWDSQRQRWLIKDPKLTLNTPIALLLIADLRPEVGDTIRVEIDTVNDGKFFVDNMVIDNAPYRWTAELARAINRKGIDGVRAGEFNENLELLPIGSSYRNYVYGPQGTSVKMYILD